MARGARDGPALAWRRALPSAPHSLPLRARCTRAALPCTYTPFLTAAIHRRKSASGFVAEFEKSIADLPQAKIATVSGRYYAMDRDQRWDRVAKAYATIVDAAGLEFVNPTVAIETSLCRAA